MTPERVTLRTLRKRVRDNKPIPFLTCYDATTAAWLWRGGVRCLLVGDTAGQVILGHDATIGAPLEFMLEITAAVRRGAPGSFVMADMPFGSYQCGENDAVRNAMAFLTRGGADVVKLEVDASFEPLVRRLTSAGVPVVAHLGSRPQTVRLKGGYRAAGKTHKAAQELLATAHSMLDAGAVMLLLEAVPAEVAQRVADVCATVEDGPAVLIGCGAGPACHGHVVVLHDLLGLTAWQPPFARPITDTGSQIEAAARRWVERVESGEYTAGEHPYRMAES